MRGFAPGKWLLLIRCSECEALDLEIDHRLHRLIEISREGARVAREAQTLSRGSFQDLLGKANKLQAEISGLKKARSLHRSLRHPLAAATEACKSLS